MAVVDVPTVPRPETPLPFVFITEIGRRELEQLAERLTR